jgi:hypothetical protein
MAIRVAAQKRDTPQFRLRSRRCTSAHTKAPDGPGSQRPGPGSSRRRPAAAGRLHRYAPITPPNSKHAGLRRRRGPVLPFLPSFASFVPVKCTHTPQAVCTAADRFSKKPTRMQLRCKAAAPRNRQQSSSAVKLQRFTAGGNADRQHMKLRRFTTCKRSSV